MSINSMMFVINCLMVVAIQVSAQESIESTANKPDEVFDFDEIKAGIVGRIIVFGDVPKLPPLLSQGAPFGNKICSQNGIPDESFIVSEDGGLANVCIYLKHAPEGVEISANEEQKSLQSIDCRFVPHVQVIRTDQQFSLVNRDPVACHFHIQGFENAFNVLIPAVQSGEDFLEKAIVFKQSERLPITVRDDIYAWKSAVILPLAHDCAAVTDQNGNFTIQGLPPGSYDFTVWHEKIGYLERKLSVEVENGRPSQILLSYPSTRFIKTTK